MWNYSERLLSFKRSVICKPYQEIILDGKLNHSPTEIATYIENIDLSSENR